MRTFFKQNKFIKNVSILMSGTIIAQVLTIALAPLLSRLYEPEAFGILAVYTSIVSIISVISAGRYELAIVVPKKNKDGANLFLLSCILVGLISILSFIILLSYSLTLSDIYKVEYLNTMYIYIPISVLFIGLYNSCNYWSTRKKHYKRLSISQVMRSTSINSIQVSGGILGLGSTGLIGGQIFGQFTATLTLVLQIIKEDSRELRNSFNISELWRLFKEYKDFPLYSSSQAFINSISQNMMPFVLLFFFNPLVVGFYSLSLRLLQMPINLVGNSVKQVFYQRANELLNNNKSITGLYLKTTFFLIVISILPVIILIFFSPTIFSFLLGEKWFDAGEYAQWLILWMFFFFISRPTVTIFQVCRKQANLLVYEIIALLIKVSVLLVVCQQYNAIISIATFSIMNVIHYFLLIIVVIRILKKERGLLK